MVDAGDDGVEALAQEVEILADQVEAAGHRQEVDFGAGIGDEDVAAGKETQILFQNAIVDFETGRVFLTIRRDRGRRRDAVVVAAEVVADDLVSVEVLAEGIAAKGLVAVVERRMGAFGVGDDFSIEGYGNEDVYRQQ